MKQVQLSTLAKLAVTYSYSTWTEHFFVEYGGGGDFCFQIWRSASVQITVKSNLSAD